MAAEDRVESLAKPTRLALRCPECVGWLDYSQQSHFCSLRRRPSRLRARSGLGPRKPKCHSVRSTADSPCSWWTASRPTRPWCSHPTARGTAAILLAGVIKSTLTNLDSEADTDVVLGGKINILIGADGSAHVRGTGTIFLWYSPTEAPVTETGAGLFLVHGRATETYSDEGALLNADYTGRLIDLCAKLER